MEPYSKPHLSYRGQIKQLLDRGLTIENEIDAIHVLKNVSRYRLSAYMYPFLENKEMHRFKTGSTFSKIVNLYAFDRKLRLLVLDEIERIEVAFRSNIIYEFSEKHGPFWFQNSNLFHSYPAFVDHLSKLVGYYSKSDEVFIKHFKKKYNEPLPPCWIAMEIISFGMLSQMFRNASDIEVKDKIAGFFMLPETVFSSWVHALVYTRNLCAHHSRFWNRELGIRPKMLRSPRLKWIVEAHVNFEKPYLVLCMIQYLLQTINPDSSFKEKLKALLKENAFIDVSAMGFSTGWQEEIFWN